MPSTFSSTATSHLSKIRVILYKYSRQPEGFMTVMAYLLSYWWSQNKRQNVGKGWRHRDGSLNQCYSLL